tara:strand:- start:295 stop:612 length:318 start_codon:yes stop_codon:yes gene_type:complete
VPTQAETQAKIKTKDIAIILVGVNRRLPAHFCSIKVDTMKAAHISAMTIPAPIHNMPIAQPEGVSGGVYPESEVFCKPDMNKEIPTQTKTRLVSLKMLSPCISKY